MVIKRTIYSSSLVVLLATLSILPAWGDPSEQNTPTPVYAEALNPDANVRNQPTTEGEIIGQIQPGERYVVRGFRFEWLLIEYPPSAIGLAWVHQSVVNVIGDRSQLPDIDPASLPNTTRVAVPTRTVPQSITQTPMLLLPTFTPVVLSPTLDLTTLEGQRLADSEAEIERRFRALQVVYEQQSIVLYYGENVILLEPTTIDFKLDPILMRQHLTDTLALDFDIETMRVFTTYADAKVDAYLEDIARRYDMAPSKSFDNGQLIFQAGEPGTGLDISLAKTHLIEALHSPTSRRVDLPLINLAESTDIQDLQSAIIGYFGSRGIAYNSTDSVISVYVQNLENSAEIGLQENVLHSAVSTAKIGVIANYFRYIYQEPTDDMAFRMAAAVICSSNADANLLMNVTGNGDPLAGIRQTTDTFCQAESANTRVDRHFWVGPAGEGGVPDNYYDSAGSSICPVMMPLDTSVATVVDTALQTTAAEMGRFLGKIYQCSVTGTGLAQTFPGEITQSECQMMLEILEGTRFFHMTELGLPSGIPFAHKVGYGGEAIGDVGIVYSPKATYILSIYIWDTQLDNDTYAISRWNVIGEVSRLVYNYFNMDAPLRQLQQPAYPLGGAACVLPNNPADINLHDINEGRFDLQGNPLSTACYDWPNCRPFTEWGQ